MVQPTIARSGISTSNPPLPRASSPAAAASRCTDYKVGIDDTTSFSGHQSLKMQFVSDEHPRSSARALGRVAHPNLTGAPFMRSLCA